MRKSRPAPLQTAPWHPVSKMVSGSSSWQLPTVSIAPTPSGSLQNLWGMHTLSWWWLWLFSAHQELVSIPQRLKQAFSPGGIPAGSCSCSREPPAGCSRLQSSFLGPLLPLPWDPQKLDLRCPCGWPQASLVSRVTSGRLEGGTSASPLHPALGHWDWALLVGSTMTQGCHGPAAAPSTSSGLRVVLRRRKALGVAGHGEQVHEKAC